MAPSSSEGLSQERTVSEKQEIAASNDADGIVQGFAPEAEEFLHDEDIWWGLKKTEMDCC